MNFDLTKEERDFVSKLSAISGVPENTIQSVFQGFFTLIAREWMEGNKEFYIPYLMKLKIDFSIVEQQRQFFLKEKLMATPSQNLHELLVQTYNNNDKWQDEFFQFQYEKIFSRIFNTKKEYEESEEEKMIEEFVYGKIG